MKKIILFTLIAASLQLAACSTYSQATAGDEYQSPYDDAGYTPTDEISQQTFYDDLSPYGQWINYPQYGSVWQPNVGSDFRPYETNGHWDYTDMGWTWVSDYPWGWAAFHYGRWFFDNNDGWLWVPGYDWAPAWVSWRSSSDFYGWAPLMPGIDFGVSVGYYNPPVNYWCFVPHEYIASPYINNYCVGAVRNLTIFNNTTVINNRIIVNNNRFYAAGPNVREVEQFTHSNIRPLAIRDNFRPGRVQVSNNELRMFRPRVNNSPAARPGLSATTFLRPSSGFQSRGSQVIPANPADRSFPTSRQPAFQQHRETATQPYRQPAFASPQGAFVAANRFQAQRAAPVMNSPRPAFQPPARNVPSNSYAANAFHQSQPSGQRAMPQRSAPAAPSFPRAQAPVSRSSGGGRSFGRR